MVAAWPAHELVAQRLVVQHLAPPLGRRVEHDALAEDGRHERVRLGLVELLLGRPEVELVGVRTGQQHDVAGRQRELAHVAALGPHPRHQPDRVAAELVEVAVLALAPRHPRRLPQLVSVRHGCSSP